MLISYKKIKNVIFMVEKFGYMNHPEEIKTVTGFVPDVQ